MGVPARRAKRLTVLETADIVAAYQAGCSSNALAREYKVSRNALIAVLEREGVPRRYNILTPEVVRRAATLYAQGRSLDSLGAELDVAAQTVGLALRKAGVEIRPVGTNQWRQQASVPAQGVTHTSALLTNSA